MIKILPNLSPPDPTYPRPNLRELSFKIEISDSEGARVTISGACAPTATFDLLGIDGVIMAARFAKSAARAFVAVDKGADHFAKPATPAPDAAQGAEQ